ncbi:MAG: polysaccharide biosynthesis tyrosine autokinase [Chryseolinea sp.]
MAGKKSIKQILGKLFSRWYVYLIALCITLPLAYLYLKFAPKQYEVKASLLLLGDMAAGVNTESLMKDANDRKIQAGITDQIGILRSYSMVEKAVRNLNFGVAYFTKKEYVSRERFEDAPFEISIDSSVSQAVEIPVEITRISSTRYHVKASGKDVKIYNYTTNQIENTLDDINIDEELPLDKPFANKYLSFKLKFKDRRRALEEEKMFFQLRPVQAVAEEYQKKLRVVALSEDSRIVDLSITGPVPAKEKAFISKLLQVYLKSEIDKKNDLALATIRFIDNQLNNSGDTLSERVHNALLEKRVEARISISSNLVSNTVIDKPYLANGGEPSSPIEKDIYVLALILGLGAAMSFILLKDFLNDNIVTSEDVERNTKIPFIGTISHANKREQNSIVAHTRSPVGESFRSLRVNLQYLTLGTNANVIGITSSRESEGKTFCAVNLAAVMAYSGRRTVLIDTDMRRPRVAAYFQMENRKGLSNFLVGDCSFKEIINNTEHKGFDVIGSGPIPPNPVDLIGNSRMEELINTLKQTYNTIIIDSPPVGYVSEYIILMKYTDANLYIVRSDYTNRNSLKKINNLFEREKLTNFSIVLNDVRSSKASDSYYAYGYGYGYKY